MIEIFLTLKIPNYDYREAKLWYFIECHLHIKIISQHEIFNSTVLGTVS